MAEEQLELRSNAQYSLKKLRTAVHSHSSLSNQNRLPGGEVCCLLIRSVSTSSRRKTPGPRLGPASRTPGGIRRCGENQAEAFSASRERPRQLGVSVKQKWCGVKKAEGLATKDEGG